MSCLPYSPESFLPSIVLACMLSRFSVIQFFVTSWTVACQAPLSMGFSKQEYWSRLPFSPPGDLYDPGIEPPSPTSPTWAGRLHYHQARLTVSLQGVHATYGIWRRKETAGKSQNIFLN